VTLSPERGVGAMGGGGKVGVFWMRITFFTKGKEGKRIN